MARDSRRALLGVSQRIPVDLPSVAANATVLITVSVPGAVVGDNPRATFVCAAPGALFGASSLILGNCFPSAANTVKVAVTNPTGSAVDLASEVWTFLVVR